MRVVPRKPTTGLTAQPPEPRSVTYPGSDLSADAVAFGKAMDAFKRTNRRPFPTWAEVLDVLRGLGYRKVAPPEAPPGASAELAAAEESVRRSLGEAMTVLADTVAGHAAWGDRVAGPGPPGTSTSPPAGRGRRPCRCSGGSTPGASCGGWSPGSGS